MAEIFGAVAGAVSVAAAFSAVIDVFDKVQLGRNFGRDYYTGQLQLDVLHVRLSRWGKGVDVYTDDGSARSAKPAGASHQFDGVKITGNGKTVVMNGNRFGGADPFAV